MLLHTIQKYEEPKPTYQVYTPPPRVNKTDVKSQSLYDAWLQDKFKVGTFVCFNVHSAASVTTLWMVNYVIAIEPEFDKLTFTSQGHIESHLLVQLADLKGDPWCRYCSPLEYRELDDSLKQRFLDDNVHNYIKNFTVEQAKARVRVF